MTDDQSGCSLQNQGDAVTVCDVVLVSPVDTANVYVYQFQQCQCLVLLLLLLLLLAVLTHNRQIGRR